MSCDVTKWTIDEFTPSDGSKHAFVTIDHIAWLKGERDDAASIHVALNISSRDVSEQDCKAILDAMVAGLNRKDGAA